MTIYRSGATLVRRTKVENPWGLTASEARALDLLIEHKGSKRAAHATGISVRTIEFALKRARIRMRVPTFDRLEYILLWDRWRQANKEQA